MAGAGGVLANAVHRMKGTIVMASKNVLELTTDNWQQEVVNSDKPVLVDFWAVWCGPCRALAPAIESLADKYAGKVKVGKLNTDDHQDLAVRYGISAIPQVLIFKGGEEPKERIVGLNSEAALAKALDRVLES